MHLYPLIRTAFLHFVVVVHCALSKKVVPKRERETFIENSDRPRRITVLYHLHKAGGTSLLELFNEVYGFRSFPDAYSKDEMNQFNEWSSSEGMTIFGKHSDQLKFSTSSTDDADNSRREKVNTADFWKDLHIKGLDYVSLEANGLPPEIVSEASKGAYLVAQFTTPEERLQSTLERELYLYCKKLVKVRKVVPSNEEFKTCLHKTNLDRENRDADWLKWMEERSKIWGGHMLPNYYVRHLNGLNMEPRIKLTEEHLEIAKRVVSKFDLILLLTEMSDSTKLDKLNKFYQLQGDQYPHKSNNKLKSDFPINIYTPVHYKIEKAVREHFDEDNQLDIKLYEYVKTLTEMREESGYIEPPTDEDVNYSFPVVFLFLLIPILYRFRKRKIKIVWMLIILSIFACRFILIMNAQVQEIQVSSNIPTMIESNHMFSKSYVNIPTAMLYNCSKAFSSNFTAKGLPISELSNRLVYEAIPKQTKLLLVSAGRGSSGTKSVFNTLCARGFSGIHFSASCNLHRLGEKARTVLKIQQRILQLSSMIIWNDKKKQAKLDKSKYIGHVKGGYSGYLGTKLKRNETFKFQETGRGPLYPRFITYLDTDCDNPKFPDKEICTPEGWLREMKDAITKIASSGIEFLSDTPYPAFAQYILEIEPSVVVMHTLRDAQAWLESRKKHHCVTLCNTPLLRERDALPPGNYIGPGIVESCEKLQDWNSVTSMLIRQSQQGFLSDEEYTVMGERAYQLFNDHIAGLRPRNYFPVCWWDNQEREYDSMLEQLKWERPQCGSLWPKRTSEAKVVKTFWTKNTSIEKLMNAIDYHLLIGVEHFIIIDNNCNIASLEQDLNVYILKGLLTISNDGRCTDFKNTTDTKNFFQACKTSMLRPERQYGFGPKDWEECVVCTQNRRVRHISTQARAHYCALSKDEPREATARDALMILSDDDEYIYIKDPSKKMQDIREYMEQKRVCSLGIRWRMFGSSYHDYPPLAGSYISNYLWRGSLFSEATKTTRNKMITDKAKYELNYPFVGKSIGLLANTTIDRCGNHWCTECSTVCMHSCAQFESPSKPGRAPVAGYYRNLDIYERILI